MIFQKVNELPPSPGNDRIVIIGSGAVGLYAARELTRHGRKVVVVESGGVDLENFGPETYSSVGRKHDGIAIGRSRCLGGTTNLWGGQLVEFQPIDFRGRSWLPDSQWPVSYEDILPFYEKTYLNLGLPREILDDRRIFERILGKPPTLGEGLHSFLTRWMKIPGFSVMYRDLIAAEGPLSVLLAHTAIGFDSSGARIASIRLMDSKGEAHQLDGDQFILAAGTIEISRLLLHAANAADWDCPWRGNENIGAYFQDHLGGPIASVQPIDKKRFFKLFTNIVWEGSKFQPKVRLSNEVLEGSPILNVQGVFSFDSSITENLVFLKQFLKAALYSRKITGVGDFVRNLRGCWKYLVPLMWKYAVEKRVFEPGKSTITLLTQAEQVPCRESRIRIDSEKTDSSGLPKVILDWKIGDRELPSIRDFAQRCARALESNSLARLKIPEDLINLNPRFLDKLHDTYHLSGGARIGYSENDGVVDCNLRVFGTENLYVAGAATFRTNSNANTTFTALAFTTRLVEHLLWGIGASKHRVN